MIVAAGLPSMVTRVTGNAFSELGAMPKVHLTIAVLTAA
jgi:hypothetical protein